jgi:hypothetical protein
MSGFADFSPSPPPLDMPGVPVIVYKFTSDTENEGGQLQILPNIVCLRVEKRIGAQPGRAVFKYILDPSGAIGDPSWPSTPEQVLADGASGPYIVAQDDRLVVMGYTDGGDPRIMHDGFAQAPRGKTNPTDLEIKFYTMGTPVRCSDTPVFGRLERNADDPEAGNIKLINVPVIFNPDGMANATDEGYDGALPWDADTTTPVFLDHFVCKARGIGRKWSLAMVVHYLLATYNDQTWVDYPALATLDTLFDGIKPLVPNGDIDPEDSETFTTDPIALREFDATGLPWPTVLEKLLKQYGFGFWWKLGINDDVEPIWTIQFFRFADDNPLSYTQVFLQDYGSDLDLSQTNVSAFALERDVEAVENVVVVYGRPDRFEGAFVLAPGFAINPADAFAPENFDWTEATEINNAMGDARDLDDYRLYVFDECGDGHTPLIKGAWGDFVEGPDNATSLAAILSPDGVDETGYSKRRRPGRRQLFTLDALGKPQPAQLLISPNYTGKVPGLWDGSGGWWEAGRAWDLLEDRLGIRLTADKIEAWHTGNKSISFGMNVTSKGGVIKAVSAQALVDETHFVLMLITCIEGDNSLFAEAPKRLASASKFTVKRYVDAMTRYRTDTICAYSWWNYPPEGKTGDAIVPRDDTKDAQYDAAQKRSDGEMPLLSGSVTLFGLVNTYDLTQRVTSIVGRDLDLQTNVDVTGEGAMYPMIVQVDFDLDGHQMTTLHLSDQREGRQQ